MHILQVTILVAILLYFVITGNCVTSTNITNNQSANALFDEDSSSGKRSEVPLSVVLAIIVVGALITFAFMGMYQQKCLSPDTFWNILLWF